MPAAQFPSTILMSPLPGPSFSPPSSTRRQLAVARRSDTSRQPRTDAELCGEPPRPWEAGILVGVVRRHPRAEPLAGAVVRVRVPVAGAEPFEKATVSSANGVYVLCNVPVGATIKVSAEASDGRSERTSAIIRAGTISWYDLNLRTMPR